MTADERRRACAYALAFMFSAEDEIAQRAGDAILFERMLGLRSGHGGGMASVMPFDQDTLRLARLPSPGQLRAVLKSAPEEAFELVRRILHMIVLWLPMLLPMFLEQYGAKAVPLVDVARKLFDDLEPEYYALTAIALLMSLNARAHAVEDLRSQLEAMTPAAINRDLLALRAPSRSRRTSSSSLVGEEPSA